MTTHAPSGARRPHRLTAAARSSAEPKKCVRSASHPQVSPGINPPRYVRICAGVQNVSRPIVECQEISQSTPIGMQTAPKMSTKQYAGSNAVRTVEPAAAGELRTTEPFMSSGLSCFVFARRDGRLAQFLPVPHPDGKRPSDYSDRYLNGMGSGSPKIVATSSVLGSKPH